jgi:type IV pilus assembly protein PilC
MSKFAYKIRDENNNIFTGIAEGANEEEVLDRLSDKNHIPVAIEELNFNGTKKHISIKEKLNDNLIRLRSNVPYKDLVFFTRQLATMIDAGVPLSRALSQLAESEKPAFKKILFTVVDDIAMGNTFSEAIAKHPGAFTTIYCSIVYSGEVSGSLDRVLLQLAAYMENVETLREKVKGAMRYPIFLTGFVVLLLLGILWKLVPAFENMYKGFSTELPLPTKILINISNIIQSYFIQGIGFLLLLVILIIFGMGNKTFRLAIDKYLLYIPIFGTILKKNIFSVFCRTMAILMNSGTPILQSLEVVGLVVGNKSYSQNLETVYNKLRTGELLSKALKDTKLFPVLITQLVATGEEAGKLDALLEKAAVFYECEIKVTVDSLAAIIEPFLIIILASFVGMVLIALYLPIFSLGKIIY